MYMYDTSDVRNYINTHLMDGGLIYTVDKDFEMNITHLTKVGNSHTTHILTIEKNSVASRPRLFGADKKPIELSYCDKSLVDMFISYSDFLETKDKQAKKQELIQKLQKYQSVDFIELKSKYGFKSDIYMEEIDTLKTKDLSICSTNELEKVLHAVEDLTRLASLKDELWHTPYNELTAEQKSLYHRVKWYMKGSEAHIECDMRIMWQDADSAGINFPLIHNECIWPDEVETIYNYFKELDITKIYWAYTGSATTPVLYRLMNLGARIVETAVLKDKGFGDRTADLESLVIEL